MIHRGIVTLSEIEKVLADDSFKVVGQYNRWRWINNQEAVRMDGAPGLVQLLEQDVDTISPQVVSDSR